jgi:hypothetical protein
MNPADRTRAKTARSAKSPETPAGSPAALSQASEQTPALAPETLARTLRAVAAELERDPALARRVVAALEHAAETGKNGNTASSPSAAQEGGATQSRRPASVGSDAKTAKPRTFTPRLITGTSPELGTGVPDPFALYRRLGEDGLRAALAGLRLGSLRAIIREYALDPSGSLAAQNDADRLRAAILAAARR